VLEHAGQTECADATAFRAHLKALGLAERTVTPDPIAWRPGSAAR
jgi:hypothetical protein